MSDGLLFNVILSGKIIDGFQRDRAVKSLARLLAASETQADALLKGDEKLIKKAITKEKAIKYKLLLTSCGVCVRITKNASAKVHNIAEAQKRASLKSPAKTNVTPIQTAISKREHKPGVKRVSATTVSATSKDPKRSESRSYTNTDFEQEKLQVNSAFSGVIQTEAVPLIQQLSLVASCSALVVLGVFYLGIILSVAYFSLARLATWLFTDLSAGVFSVLFVYLLPSLLAAVVVVMLIRPVFSMYINRHQSIAMDKKERTLSNFVRHIAHMLGAPTPVAISITDENGINADFLPGLNNLRNANIELKIGLPILMNLDIRTFSGAVAGALAKFDDKVGMYMQYVLREVNMRLSACESGDDSWSASIEKFEHSTNIVLSRVVHPVCHYVLLASSYLLLPLKYAVRGLSAASSRQLTFRSDNYFAGVSGTRAFVDYFRTLQLCLHAEESAFKNIQSAMEARKYVNDLPALIAHAFKTLPDSVFREVDDEVVEHSTRWDDLEPCNRDRIITAEEVDRRSIVVLESEAYRLIKNFKLLSRDFTLNYYEQLGIEVDQQALVAAREVASSSNEEKLRDEVCSQYFNGWFEPDLFWQTNHFAYAKSISKQQRIVEINECIKILRRSSPDFMALKTEVPERFSKFATTRLATEIHKAGYRLDTEIPGLEGVSLSNLASVHNSSRRDYESRRAQQRDFCRVMGERLCFALAFLPDERERKVSDMVLSMLSALEAQANQLEALRVSVHLAPQYLQRAESKRETEHLKRVRRLSRDIFSVYELAMAEFKRFRWPFGKQYQTLADFVSVYLPADFNRSAEPGGTIPVQDRIELYQGLWRGVTEANRYLNGKIAPLAQKAELDNSIARIKMTVKNNNALVS